MAKKSTFTRLCSLLLFFLGLTYATNTTSLTQEGNIASLAGTSSVTWIEGSNVNIITFSIDDQKQLVMYIYSSAQAGWVKAIAPTGVKVNNNHDDAVSTTQVDIGQPNHAIHVFYTTDYTRKMRSIVYQVKTGDFVDDEGFNNLGVAVVSPPRAAIGWTNDDSSTSLRVYFIKLNVHSSRITSRATYTYPSQLYELQFEKGQWSYSNNGNPIESFTQEDGSWGNGVAAVTYKSDKQNIRLYYYGVKKGMIELSWTGGTEWKQTKYWKELYDETTVRYPLTATIFTTDNGRQIRLYRHMRRSSHPNKVREWGYSEDTQKWTDGDLPQDLITDTDGDAQPSVVSWTYPDAKSPHIRLYQYKSSTDGANHWVTEDSYDPDGKWRADTATLG